MSTLNRASACGMRRGSWASAGKRMVRQTRQVGIKSRVRQRTTSNHIDRDCWTRVGRSARIGEDIRGIPRIECIEEFYLESAGNFRSAFASLYGKSERRSRSLLSAALPVLGITLTKIQPADKLVGSPPG